MEKPKAVKKLEIGEEHNREKPRLKEGSFINYAFPGEETRKEAKEKFSKIFFEQKQEMEKLKREGVRIEESEKSPKQVGIINYADNLINQFLEKEGLSAFKLKIPSENVHISRMNKEKFNDLKTIVRKRREENERSAVFSPLKQAIFIQQPESHLRFFKDILRASLEAKSYQEVTKFGHEDYRNTKSGVSEKYYPPGESSSKEYFKNLNDGIIAKLTKELYEKSLTDPNLPEHLREEIKSNPVMEEDKFSAKNREILDTLIKMLYGKKAWKVGWETKEAQEKMFHQNLVKSFITGDTKKLEKLMDDTLGKGATGKIGKLDRKIGDTENLESFINELK
jgi:hypothetical protein